MSLKLTEDEQSNITYGISVCPWLEEEISKVLKTPTKEGIQMLAEDKSVEGHFKQILLDIIAE